jgi:hypothetical protein
MKWFERRGVLLAMCAAMLVACGGGQSGVEYEAAQQDGVALNTKSLDDALLRAEALPTDTDLDRLLPGAVAPLSAYESGAVSRKVADARVAVFRFFNTGVGVHFYTSSVDEREQVYKTLTFMEPEGEAFYAASAPSAGLSPVYRFFNSQTGVHFYTISETERAMVVASLPQYKYEGVAYYASLVPAAGFTPLYRFYLKGKGVHFYTASAQESESVQTNLGATHQFEGVAYYVMNTACALPPCGATGPNRPRVFIPLTGNNDLANNAGFDGQWPYVRQNAHGIWGNNADITDAESARLIRKLATRNLITEYPVPSPGSAWLPREAFTNIQRLYADILLNPEGIAFYTDTPSTWAGRNLADATAIYTDPTAPVTQRYSGVYTGWQPYNFDPADSRYLYANASAILALRSSKGTFVECPVNLCAEGRFGEMFKRAIRETHVRGRPFVWFTSNTSKSSGWLADFQQTYNAIAAENLWRPEDAVVIVNYGGTYPKVPESVGGAAADTTMGLAYWAIQQRVAATVP